MFRQSKNMGLECFDKFNCRTIASFHPKFLTFDARYGYLVAG